MNIEQILESAPGGVSREEWLALAKYAAAVDAGHIVEIGSYKGKSAMALAHGVRQAGRSGKVRLYCIDPHLPFIGQLGGKFGPVDRRDFFTAMIESGAYEEAGLINLPAREVALGWSHRLGLLFIDGDHRYHAVRDDFLRWVPHVLDGGVIALDDTGRRDVGPTRLAAELIEAGFTPIEKVGKITFFRKLPDMPQIAPAPTWRSVLVIAERNVLAGGLLRFSRLQAAWERYGISVTFAFEDLTSVWTPDNCDVLQMDQALERQWDATVLPGAGFSRKFIESLNRFISAEFGVRVQMVLNDRHSMERFLNANHAFSPHSVIFNTRDWTPGSYSRFKGDRFAVVEGAVDAATFAPAVGPGREADGRFVVGLQSKYLAALAPIVPLLPETTHFRIMRSKPPIEDLSPSLQGLAHANRLEFRGLVGEADLPDFYHACDCILHLESSAGWANLVAEAMASGVPVVCSAAGTAAIAEDEVTALLVAPDDHCAVASALRAVQSDPASALSRAREARARILDFSWERYGSQLLAAAHDDGRNHYLCAPGYGLRGKWPLVSRLEGIEPILAFAKGARVLDIGCAEGVIARKLIDAGAAQIHGFDADPERITTARYICESMCDASFAVDSVTPWHEFQERRGDTLNPRYDIVLYLAVHQHLKSDLRDDVLINLLSRADDIFAIRTPDELFENERLSETINRAGFELLDKGGSEVGGAGLLRVFRRVLRRDAAA